MGFDFHVHGLWILGALFFFVAGLMAGNLQWVAGTTEVSFGISALLIFLLFLIAAMFWISAAVNARHEEFRTADTRNERAETKPDDRRNVYVNVYRNGRLEKSEEVPKDW